MIRSVLEYSEATLACLRISRWSCLLAMSHTSKREAGWDEYRRALRPTDQAVFDRLFEYAQLHTDSRTVHKPLFVETPILISILLEQQRQLDDLVDRLDHVEDDLNDRG